ncbi:hypothetical protein D0T49_12510 [Paludibacter sp. 221]|uniref:FISUMP domain-containing protein n=1 Tax=Paludibacter sp. 221 TaxID=2302939 RepID=UPI0013D566C6|nr:FISUMP domain-containing protein [Paludibacter sp. 221]NDV47869.1 hypothetical protein [Paludibacter sp. 221]
MNRKQFLRQTLILVSIFQFSFFIFNANAQVTIGADKEPESFSSLEIISTTAGLRLPQLTMKQREVLTEQLEALTSETKKQAAKGLVIYNLDTECTDTWNGARWSSVCDPLDPTTSPCGAYLDNGVWLKFMCYNLGADTSFDPFAPAAGIHGAKYKWGIGTPIVTQAEDQETNLGLSKWSSWPLAPTTTDEWDMVNENPCPAGWRLPTDEEFRQVISNNEKRAVGTWDDNAANFSVGMWFGNALFLPVTGYRNHNTGGFLYNRGSSGYYWTSSPTSTSANGGTLGIWNATGITVYQSARNNAVSVRCVEDN